MRSIVRRGSMVAVVCLLALVGFAGSASAARDREALRLGHLVPQRVVAYSRGTTLLLGRPDRSVTLLARVTAGGTGDRTFGDRGILRIGFSVTDVAAQGDGRIVAVGYGPRAGGTGREMLVARFLYDGSPDSSFGVGGIATVGLGQPDETARSVAIASGGKIVVGGSSGVASSRFDAAEAVVVQLGPDGALDPAFGNGGSVRLSAPRNFSTAVKDVAVLPTGGIVAALPREDGILEIAQLGPHGTPVRSSARRSFAVEPPGFDPAKGVSLEPLDQIGVLPSGRIVVVATRRASSGRSASMVALRYLPSGRLDPSFGGDGMVVSRLRYAAAAFAVQHSGWLAIASGMNAVKGFFSVLCLSPNGRLDPRFGKGGVARVTFGVRGWQNRAGALTFQAKSRITVAGTATLLTPSSPYPQRTGIARLRLRVR